MGRLRAHYIACMWTVMAALPVGAQVTMRWEEFTPCPHCRLTVRRVLELGDADGPGTVDSRYADLVWGEGRGFILYSPRIGRSAVLFDQQGEYLRSIGTGGEGPGELLGVYQAAFAANGDVIILDVRKRWMRFRQTGELVSDQRHRGPLGSFHLEQGDSVALVFGWQRTPDAVGYPIHRMRMSTGGVIERFGIHNSASWSVAGPSGSVVVAGRTAPTDSTVWWGRMRQSRLEEWSLRGTPRRVIAGDLEWLSRPSEHRMGPAPPHPLLSEFAVDSSDKLWMISTVPDRRWREVPRGIEGSIPESEYDRFWDSRLDVFDLRTKRHLGSKIWDQRGVRLLRRGSSVFVYLMEFASPEWPRIMLYTVDGFTPTEGRK